MSVALALVALLAADTTEYVVHNHGRPAGDMRVVTDGDSAHVVFGYQDRQRGPDRESRYRFAADGSVARLEVATGDRVAGTPRRRSEWMAWEGRELTWRSSADSGRVRAPRGAVYVPMAGNPFDLAHLARTLLARPDRSAAIVPAGTARATVAADTMLSVGGRAMRLRLVLVNAATTAADGVWLDERGALVATGEWFVTVRRGMESLLPALRAIEQRVHARRGLEVAQRLHGAAPATPAAPTALVIRNGDLFDSERGVVVPRQTIVIEGERIVAVGPAASTATPAGARVVDATGKTIVPGLWDMHTHLFGPSAVEDGAMHLAAGVTTVRDMAADIDDAVDVRARSAAGTLVAPRYLLAGFLEGHGLWAGPTEALARDEAEAARWIARYDSLGYRQVKLYNAVHPDFVPSIVADARRRGMRVSGHVPRGLTLENAVRLGFDEVNHLAFLLSTFHQDSLYVPRMRAYSSVASAVQRRFDPDAPRVTELIAFLKASGTVVDPTLNLYQQGVPLADGLDPQLGAARAWLPVGSRRGSPVVPDSIRAMGERDRAVYGRLVKRLFDAGVPVVPGTDNVPGLALHGELEAYERAGIPAPAVLQLATIGAARVMKEDTNYGSIAVGKVADLAIVDGQPAERIADIRRTEQVVKAGRLYRSRDLYAVANVTAAWPGRVATRGAGR